MKPPGRHLLVLGIGTALLLGLGSARALDPTRDKILYMVATAHLDDQWNWTIQNTINTYIPNTLRQNFAYFTNANYTNYTFSFEEAWRYQLINEYYPSEFATLTNYIAQGRWRIGGSAMVAGDVNTPAPESLIRQTLYANTYWKQQFGKTSLDIFLPDCFGFSYALPSVAAHCGLKGFSSQKLSWGCWTNIPFQNIGRWIGPDGSSIIAVLQPGSYTSSIGVNLANDPGELTRMTNIFNQTGLYLDYRYFGTGDTGGSPSAGSVSNVCLAAQTTNGAVNVLSTGSDQLFRDLTPSQTAMLPAYQGELLLTTHGTGTYTAHAENKKYHRQCELGAAQAECAAVMADWLQGGGTYPQERLNKVWARFLWHEFHDDLTGTSIPQAYTFSWNDYLLSLNELAAETACRVGVLAKALDTSVTGMPLVVFNPVAVAREDLVEASVTFANGAPVAVRVFDLNGTEVPSQMGTPSGSTVPVTFLANVPSMGAAVYDVRPSTTPSPVSTGLSVTTSQLENARYRVQLNAGGDVASILDKVNNQQLLSAPIRWDFLYDLSTTYPAWEIRYSDVVAAPSSYLTGPASFQVLENGPARVTLAVARNNAGSSFTERIRLAAGGAGDRIEWDVSANWASPHTLLKLEFPLAVTNSRATFDLGLGTARRGNATSSLYEVPAQQWADLTSPDGAYGVTILNDCKYGWDKPNNNTLRQTIFHTPAVGSSYTYEAIDSFGSHRMLLAVMGHTNDWRAARSPWVAARLNQPLQAFQTERHSGTLGKSFGFLSCDNANVMVKALKKAENTTELVVRLQELAGQPQTAQLSFATPVLTARQVTGAEDPITSLYPSGGKVIVSLGAYQPMTLAVTVASPAGFVPKPASVPVSLPFNVDAISTDANRTDGNFDGGYTYPAELMPATLVRDGVGFQLGPTNAGASNALACQGQAIALPAGYDHLYLLAAAASNDVVGAFSINGQPTNLTVRYFSGFIGQWNPPSLKRDEVGWVCTHRHTGGGANGAYEFCYLFKYRLDLPPAGSTLVLPNTPNIRVFAMTLTTNTTPETTIAGGRLGEKLQPWANAGPDRTLNAATTNGTTDVTLDASGSADADGTIVSYVWSQNGAVLANGANPTVTLPMGTNSIVLTVTDDQGATGQDVVTVTVLPPLTVLISALPTSGNQAPLTVQFTGEASGVNISPNDTTDDHLGTITAQGQNSPNEMATNAFDNDLSSKWLDFANSYPSTRQSWLQYQYASGVQRLVTSYSITSGNDASGYPARNPANWRLLGSNDGGTNWTTLDIQTNQTFTASQQTRAWNVTSPGNYSVYRLQIDSVANPASANSVQLDEIQFIGLPVYNYWWSFGDGGTSTAQNPQHIYTNIGNYLVILGVSCGAYTGTNSALITIGAPLTAALKATPELGATPLTVQFTGQASGGNGARVPYDTTDDQRGIITAQGNNAPNETCVKAFDNIASTKWLDYANGNPSTRSSWIQYQYAGGLQCTVSQYAISSANDAPARDPASWRLLGSNDAASWTTLDARTNQVFANRFQTLSFPVINTGAFNIYRLQVDSVAAPASANSVQLSELQFIGNSACSYQWLFGDGSSSTAQSPRHTYASKGTYTVILVVSDGTATVSTSTTVSALPLLLAVAQPAPGRIALSWPVWGSNCTLYSTMNLSAPVLWSVTSNTVTAQSDVNMVELTAGPGTWFFQLRP